MSAGRPDFFKIAHELSAAGTPFVAVTMVSARGSAPQEPGAKMIVTEDGLLHGTIGGGKVELRAIAYAKEFMGRGAPEPVLMVWNLQRDIGMTCGGEVTYLFETHRSDAWKIVLFGAGHVAQALVRTLEPLRCRITCIDARAEWLEKLPRSLNLRAIHHSDPASLVESADEESFFAVMTQGHATDMPILKAILSRFPEPRYLGSIGSDIKALKIRAELKAAGIAPEAVARLRCPIGLPLGGNDPAEIAISIVAELLQARDGSRETT